MNGPIDLQSTMMAADVSVHDWLPGPVTMGPIPLSVDELEQLYAFNLALTEEDASELSQPLPYLGDVLSPEQFTVFVRKRITVLPDPGSNEAARGKDAAATAKRTLAAVADLCGSSSAKVVTNLRKAVFDLSPEAYEAAYVRLSDLSGKRKAFDRRKTLLARLAMAAPNWAAAIEARTGVHGGGTVPGDAIAAWQSRQAQQD